MNFSTGLWLYLLGCLYVIETKEQDQCQKDSCPDSIQNCFFEDNEPYIHFSSKTAYHFIHNADENEVSHPGNHVTQTAIAQMSNHFINIINAEYM